MTLNDSVLAFRLHVLAHAKRSGNVSATCRELGVSRTLFYRWKKRLGQYGRDGLHPTRQQARRGRPPNLSLEEEQAIVALALSCPAWGPQRLAIQLARQGRALSPSSVYRALRRMVLGRRTDRLLVLEQFSAVNQGLVTERTRRQLDRRCRRRHVEVTDPGELVCLDTFYIGKLKGVGRSGSSRPAMRPVPTLRPPSFRRLEPSMLHASCSSSSSPSLRPQVGRSSGGSRTGAASSRRL